MAQVDVGAQMRQLLRKVRMKLPHLDLRPRPPERVQLKTTVSRKALQAYFDMKFSSQDLAPLKSTARSLSYSKLLQETPDTFRKQRTSRKVDPSLLQRPLKKVNSLVGIQGVKSVLRDKGAQHTARRCEPKKLMKTLTAATATQGFRGFGQTHLEEFDPDVIDICPDLYLREMQLTRRSESTFPQVLLRPHITLNSSRLVVDNIMTEGHSGDVLVCTSAEETVLRDPRLAYLEFLRSLPPLKPSAMKTLPAKTRHTSRITLVLDLDETLIHSEHEWHSELDQEVKIGGCEGTTVFMQRRPYLVEFLQEASALFELVLFTAAQREYADELLKLIDPNRRLLRHRLYRESCTLVNGVYVKDLSILGRDLSQVLIIDNSLFAFAYHLDNGILVRSWYEDRQDTVLQQLLQYLKTFIVEAEDVRMVLRKHFELFRLMEPSS